MTKSKKPTFLLFAFLVICSVMTSLGQSQKSYKIHESMFNDSIRFAHGQDTIMLHKKKRIKGGYVKRMVHNSIEYKLTYNRKEGKTNIVRDGTEIGYIKKLQDKSNLFLLSGGVYTHQFGKNRFEWSYTKNGKAVSSFNLTKEKLLVEHHSEDDNLELLNVLAIPNAVKKAGNQRVIAVIVGAALVVRAIYSLSNTD